ncbi:MAG: hypothetical protein H0U99_08950 [Chthoniobacterales bacterium]|nr:hypothetical protein [Chthoniobacterales bacterium]
MIAITFALPTESSGVRRLLVRNAQDAPNSGMLNGRPVQIFHTGVGERVSTPRIEKFLERRGLSYLISAGFAGALDPELRVGDVVMGSNFSSASLVRAANFGSQASIRVGKLISSSQIVESCDARAQLARSDGAIAVDMETEGIARACAQADLPMLALRAISDTADAPFPAPARVLFDIEKQRTVALRLVLHLIREPAAIRRLLRFRRQIDLARQALTTAISNAVASIPKDAASQRAGSM